MDRGSFPAARRPSRQRRMVAELLAALLVSLSCVLGLATPAAAAGGYVLSVLGGTGVTGSPVPGPVAASPLAQPSAISGDTGRAVDPGRTTGVGAHPDDRQW